MDDGGLLSYNKDYTRKGLVFNTHGFNLSKVEILSQNLNTWVKTNKNKFIIAVSGQKFHEIRNLIYPHIIESMTRRFAECLSIRSYRPRGYINFLM
jgi:hypothetical protein